ncbi:hypothetical protein AW27_026475 [Streptomyces sp. PCS3-D2]|uniref:hypothetical protein n=1 Tax=Streptomyces sp. PCS3-D2 TaxID=1460244 RepID=UPI00044F6AC8|nr:hypothetical protein [Streptomyces sp. PCS3-D2]WKV74248.1 hypothetical protein AW27_023690 [Streptomyces sp. PCS3-D2]WKV74754.1 hypothetical protein AW27_026475 [Streptomyces sp. PCS3-D2]
MTLHAAPTAPDLHEAWADTAPVPFGSPAPVPPARTAAEDLAAKGRHVHLVSGDEVECLNHRGCVPLPGI